MTKRFSGVVPALAVPFKGCEVDFELLSEHVNRLLGAGISGLFVVSTTGLGHTIGLKSKLELVKFVVENKKSIFIIVNVASIEFEEIKELVRVAEKTGADAVASNVLYYFRVDEEGALKFFTKVASLTELPFFVYNIPQNTGFNVDPALIRKIKEKARNTVGVKDSSGNVLQIAELVAIEDLAVFNGNDETSLPALVAGADGYVSALANVFPELFVKMYKAYREGDLTKATELYRKVLSLAVDLKAVPLYISIYEALSAIYGRKFGLMETFREAKPSEREKVIKALNKHTKEQKEWAPIT